MNYSNKIIALLSIFLITGNFLVAQCNASFSYVINTGGNVTFTNTSTGNFTTTFWDFGDGNTAWWYSGSHTFPYNGTFNVCLTVADTASSCFNTYCTNVTITNGNASCITTAWSLYNGILSYNFSSGTQGVQPFTYAWDFGDGNNSTQTSPFHTYAANGIYTVIVDVMDNLGCLSSDTIVIDFSCTAGYTYINNGAGNFSFTSVMTNPTCTYFWDFGDGNNSIAQNPNHTYSNDGPYNVCLTVTDPLISCSATYCDSVVATGTGNINCSFAYGTNQSFPNGPTFNFWQLSNGSTFLWDFGDGNNSTQANPNHTYAAQGTYTYCVSVDNCPMVCGNVTAFNCQSSFYFYPDSLNVFDVIVINTAIGNNLTYLWDFGDGNTSTQQFPQHTYAANSTYWLCLTINNGNGCVDTFCDSIDGSGINKTGFTINIIGSGPTSINQASELNKSKINIYPNPSIDVVNFNQLIDKIKIFNLNGKLVYEDFSKSKIDVSHLAKGLYTINVYVDNDLPQHIKLIKQ